MKLGQYVTGLAENLAVIGTDFNYIAHVDVVDWCFKDQGARIFHGVEENRGDFVADTDATGTFVRHAGDVVTKEPQYRVGCRLARGAGTHHVADKGDRQTFGFNVLNLFHRADFTWLIGRQAVAGHFVGRQGMQGYIRTGPGIGCRGQIIGIGFASHLEDYGLDTFGDSILPGKPLGIGPGLKHGFCLSVAGIGFFGDIMECIENQNSTFQLFRRTVGEVSIIQQLNQRFDVVAAVHIAEQCYCSGAVDQWTGDFAFGYRAEKAGFDISRFIHTGWNAVGDKVE